MIIDWCTSIKDIVSVTVTVKNISTGIETSVCAEWSGSSVTSTAVHMDHSSTYNVTVIVVLSNCRQSVSSAPHTFHGCGHDFMMSTGFTTIISPQPTKTTFYHLHSTKTSPSLSPSPTSSGSGAQAVEGIIAVIIGVKLYFFP